MRLHHSLQSLHQFLVMLQSPLDLVLTSLGLVICPPTEKPEIVCGRFQGKGVAVIRGQDRGEDALCQYVVLCELG